MTASTYNFTNGSIKGVPKMTEATLDENWPRVLRQTVDFTKQALDAGEADVGQCLIIPAGTTVLDADIRVITAETANATVNLGYGDVVDYWGKDLSVGSTGTVGTVLTGTVAVASGTVLSATLTATSGSACSVSTSGTLVGASLGDSVSVSSSIDTEGLILTASVTLADTVEVTVMNPTAASVTLAAFSAYVVVDKAPRRGCPLYFADADTLDVTMTTANGDVDMDGAKLEISALCVKQINKY